jgi:hypothetical protein
MNRIVALLVLAMAFLLAPDASADWSVVTDEQLVQAADQSVIRHEWTATPTDSSTYDISACSGKVEARFDPSTTDESTDATMDIRVCKNSTDTWQYCRDVGFPGPNDGQTWIGLNAITQGENYILTNALTGTSGGDTARVEIRCTQALDLVPNQASGGGVEVITQAALASAGTQDVIYQVTDATTQTDCATGTPGVQVAYCGWTGSGYIPVGVAGGTDNLGDHTATMDLDLNNNDIVGARTVGAKHYYVSTQAELEAALHSDECGVLLGDDTPTGCVINVEGGKIPISTTVALLGATGSSSLGSHVTIRGAGAGLGNYGNSTTENMPTTFSWTGAAGQPMFTVGAGYLNMTGVAIQGENGVADASNALKILNTAGAPIKMNIHEVSMYGFSDFAILGPRVCTDLWAGAEVPQINDGPEAEAPDNLCDDDGTTYASAQWDESTFKHVYISDAVGGVQVNHNQSIGITLGPKFSVTNMRGTGPFIDINYGNITMHDSYCGIVSDNSICVEFPKTANQVALYDNQFEGPGPSCDPGDPLTGIQFIDADDAAASANFQELHIRNNQFIIAGASNTALDYQTRGTLVWEDNNYIDVCAGTADDLAVTIDRSDTNAGDRLDAKISGNWRNMGSITEYPGRWIPTVGTDVRVSAPVIVGETSKIPASCGWWEVARDTSLAVGSQELVCSGGVFVSSSLGGDITTVGDCTGPTCFDGLGAESELYSQTGLGLYLDSNNDGTSTFRVLESSGPNVVFTASETGAVTTTGELFADRLGIEFEAGDVHTDCSAFSATGGSIFFDDSLNTLMKCENNVLTALDTGGGGGAVSTDVIWDAAGDMVRGTGSNTAERFAIGANNTVLTSNGTTPGWDATPAIVGTDFTGVASAMTAGSVTIVDNEATNESNAILFAPNADLDGGNLTPESDGDLTYTPSTGTLSATVVRTPPSAAPKIELTKDTADDEVSVELAVVCTDDATTTEDCGFTLAGKNAGTLANIIAASSSGGITLTSPSATGDSALVLPPASVSQAELVQGVLVNANMANDALDPDKVIGDSTEDDALDVAAGGTGRATGTTAYGLIAAGTTATGDQQTLAAGATTEVLVGGGASALPVWTTATGSGVYVESWRSGNRNRFREVHVNKDVFAGLVGLGVDRWRSYACDGWCNRIDHVGDCD